MSTRDEFIRATEVCAMCRVSSLRVSAVTSGRRLSRHRGHRARTAAANARRLCCCDQTYFRRAKWLGCVRRLPWLLLLAAPLPHRTQQYHSLSTLLLPAALLTRLFASLGLLLSIVTSIGDVGHLTGDRLRVLRGVYNVGFVRQSSLAFGAGRRFLGGPWTGRIRAASSSP